MAKKTGSRRKTKSKAKSKTRTGRSKSSRASAKKPSRKASAKAKTWYAYCTVKKPPHGSNMGAYFDWAGPRRATRNEAVKDKNNHNANAGHMAQVLSAP